jgi:hypothetical protein
LRKSYFKINSCHVSGNITQRAHTHLNDIWQESEGNDAIDCTGLFDVVPIVAAHIFKVPVLKSLYSLPKPKVPLVLLVSAVRNCFFNIFAKTGYSFGLL